MNELNFDTINKPPYVNEIKHPGFENYISNSYFPNSYNYYGYTNNCSNSYNYYGYTNNCSNPYNYYGYTNNCSNPYIGITEEVSDFSDID